MSFKIQQSNEEINSIGGLSLVGGLLNSLKNLKLVNKLTTSTTRTGVFKHCDILKTAISLFAVGKSEYADITQFRNNTFFSGCLKLPSVPSEEILRQRLDQLGEVENVSDIIKASSVELLKKASCFGSEIVGDQEYIPVDIDVSPFDNSGSNKEEVSWTYKNHDGYAPIFAYIGTHGYMLNCELRPGSQHSNKNALEFMEETLNLIEELGIKLSKILVRLDSAHDDHKIITLFQNRGVNFIIKRNLRKECKEQWLANARRVGEAISSREGKNVYIGDLSHVKPAQYDSEIPIFATFEVIERIIDKKGNKYLIPDVEVNTFWTNLPEKAENVIKLYHLHGTSEQFHSELKSDLDFERLPSGKFATNSLLLILVMLSFNILRLIGQKALEMKDLLPRKFNVIRRRLRSVLQDLIYIACKKTRHSNQNYLKFGRYCLWFKVFQKLHVTYC